MGKVELDKAVKLSQGYLIAKMLVSNDIGNIPKEIDSLALQELSVLAKNNLNTVGEALVRHDKTLCDLWGADSVKPLVAVTMEKMYDNTKIETVPPFKAYFYSVMQEKPKEVIIRSVMDMERHIGANPFPMFLPNEMEHCKVWFSATDSANNDFVNCNINVFF